MCFGAGKGCFIWKGCRMNHRLCRLAVLLACGTATSALAQNARPRVWVWGTPTGIMSSDRDFVKMYHRDIKQMVGGTWITPQAVADSICSEIVSRTASEGDQTGRIAIILQNYGKEDGPTDLMRHPNDEMIGPMGGPLVFSPSPPAYPAGTPSMPVPTGSIWHAAGLAQSTAWMQAFVDRFATNQTTTPAIPNPHRFHFDNEDLELSCCGDEHVWRYFAFRACIPGGNTVNGAPDIWNTGAIATPHDPSGWSTAAALLAAAYEPDRTKPLDSGQLNPDLSTNRDLAKILNGMSVEQFDRLMEESAYNLIEQQWPTVRCSNYEHSVRADGIDGRDIPSWWKSGASWAFGPVMGSASMQAPVFYAAHPDHDPTYVSPDPTGIYRATVNRSRKVLDAIVHSFGGGHSSDVAAWISLIGVGEDADDRLLNTEFNDFITDRESLYRILALARSRNIQEFILFTGDTTRTIEASTESNPTEKIVDHVWGSQLSSFTLEPGKGSTSSTNPVADLAYTLKDPVVITPNGLGEVGFVVNIATNFRDQYIGTGPRPLLRKLRLTVASEQESTAFVSVEILNPSTNTWVLAGTQAAAGERDFEIAPAMNYLSSTQSVTVRVRYTNVIDPVQADMVQLIAVGSRCPGDANDDGVVDFFDNDAVYDNYGMGGIDILGDANDDGVVDSLDFISIMNNLGTTGCR